MADDGGRDRRTIAGFGHVFGQAYAALELFRAKAPAATFFRPVSCNRHIRMLTPLHEFFSEHIFSFTRFAVNLRRSAIVIAVAGGTGQDHNVRRCYDRGRGSSACGTFLRPA